MDATKKKDLRLDLHHLTRVEGHGNIVVGVRDGIVEQCELQIVEAPRFFEAMLRRKPYEQVPHLASRICGICAVAHTTASLRAIEDALGVEPSEQTRLLRALTFYAEMLDSHILHTYLLVAPDLFGQGSAISLARSQPELVLRALRMKKLAGDICTAIGGRHTHPITMVVGGFTHHPTKEELRALGERLEAARVDVETTVELFQGLSIPPFQRDTEFIALHKEGEYPFIDGDIASSDGGLWPVDQYRDVTNEHLVSHSTAKRSRNRRQSYMVGALARFNLNHAMLHPKARKAAAALSLTSPCSNPFTNTIAQVVETAHCLEQAIETVVQLLDSGLHHEEPSQPTRRSGEGVGACEAPRGTLFHHYVIKNGYLTEANCITPTAQNLANIEADMRAMIPPLLDRPPEEIIHPLEMLVRAYDPCISCSTHTWEVGSLRTQRTFEAG